MGKPIFKKHQYIKVILIQQSKAVNTFYVKPNKDRVKVRGNFYLINSEHIFYDNQFKTIFINESTSECFNPLDFDSAFTNEEFNAAINNKLITEAFNTSAEAKVDFMKLAIFATLGLAAAILFFIIKGNNGGVALWLPIY